MRSDLTSAPIINNVKAGRHQTTTIVKPRSPPHDQILKLQVYFNSYFT